TSFSANFVDCTSADYLNNSSCGPHSHDWIIAMSKLERTLTMECIWLVAQLDLIAKRPILTTSHKLFQFVVFTTITTCVDKGLKHDYIYFSSNSFFQFLFLIVRFNCKQIGLSYIVKTSEKKSVTSFFAAFDALCEEGTATPVCKALDEIADISVPGTKDHVKVQGEILEGLVARIVSSESTVNLKKVLEEIPPSSVSE
ncbi:hypothetical protein KI387_042697, partial [Taxus chinensis]